MPRDPMKMSPDEFEQYVRDELHRTGKGLSKLNVSGKRDLPGSDGDYEIDASATFEGLGAEFLVVVECKRHTRPVTRDHVMPLAVKVRSLGAHKGMVFSTSGFQKGAIEYAEAHGIALFHVKKGSTSRLAKAKDTELPGDLEFASWRTQSDGVESLFDPINPKLLAEIFLILPMGA